MRTSSFLSGSFAHRGLHNTDKGIVENTEPAVKATLSAGYGLEVDIQMTLDEELIIFHDYELDRLTTGKGKISEREFEELKNIPFKTGDGKIWSLQQFLKIVGKNTPVLLEAKTQFERTERFADRLHDQLKSFEKDCQITVMSFDQDLVIQLKRKLPNMPIGLVVTGPKQNEREKFIDLYKFIAEQNIDFVAYDSNDLPNTLTDLISKNLNIPLLTWTIRDRQTQDRVEKWVDGIIFEQFLPHISESKSE